MKDISLQFTDKQQYSDIVINSGGWTPTCQPYLLTTLVLFLYSMIQKVRRLY